VPEGWHRKAVSDTELGSGGSGWLMSAEAGAEGKKKGEGPTRLKENGSR
jgi:hypothetical protein